VPDGEIQPCAALALVRLELAPLPRQLSMGSSSAAIARAIVFHPSVVLMDCLLGLGQEPALPDAGRDKEIQRRLE
jgi:ABC-type sugar transport system ATPase subunit